MSLRVQQVRFRATVQDLGRPGYAHLGVPTAGAADRSALARANALVGNVAGAAAIEVVLGGLDLRAEADAHIAVVGADWALDGVAATAATSIAAGSVISVRSTTGVYGYLAVAGGIDVPIVLGSRSTDTLSRIGPPPLRVGDRLAVGIASGRSRSAAAPGPADGPLRVVPGPRADWFTEAAVQALLATAWTVTPDSDRVGVRLSGPALQRRQGSELPSEGMVAGAVQVPPDGQPIVLLANHPTTGGYPVIAVVVSGDIDRAAQHRPGATMRFTST